MDAQRKKQLLEEYKHRRPEMGVIALRCRATGEAFFGTSNDTRADFNSLRVKLNSKQYPNKRLQALWNGHGPEGFELSVIKVLKYEDPHEDHWAELEELREQCLAQEPEARRIWK